MNSIQHTNQYNDLSDLNTDIEKLKSYGYSEIGKSDDLNDFQYRINGPRGLNASRFEGPEAYFLDWKHPEGSKAYCLYSSCGRGLQAS